MPELMSNMCTAGWILPAGCRKEAFEVVVNLESWANHAARPRRELRLDAVVEAGQMQLWKATGEEEQVLASSANPGEAARVALVRNFEFRLPLVVAAGCAHRNRESARSRAARKC